MAGWDVGGTEMLRSLSDWVVPPTQNSLIPRVIRKRQLHHLEIIDNLREWKRPRAVTHSHSSSNAAFQSNPPPAPAFFIIKEAYGDPIHEYKYESVSSHIDTPCLDLRVRSEKEPPSSVDRVLETKDNKHHDAAARLVEADMADYRRRRRLSQHERILKSLISPKALCAEFEIDDEALQGIFYAANELFFRGSLKGRVAWTWEDLPTNLIGTTAWRDAPSGHGYETLIFLSRQILKNKKYNRRLLISTFIHELIHSYLFVCCGYHPDDCGGHTGGFRRIAVLINNWVGEQNLLQLHKMEAELSDFETGLRRDRCDRRAAGAGGCQVQWLGDGTLGYVVLRPGLRSQCQDGGWK